ncbi:hypothetical protein ACFL3H_03775 [Gemmatimonadota bacterium]
MSRINRSFIGLALAFATILIVADTAAAQNPNFAGNWVLNQAESTLGGGGGGGGGRGGGMGGGASATMAITHQGNTITITTTRVGRDGATTEQVQVIIADGEAHTTDSPRGPTTVTATWKDGKLAVASTMTMNMQGQTREITTNAAYSMAGGKLIFETTRAGRDGTATTTKAVYDKKD